MASASPLSPFLHLRGGGRQHEQALLLPSLPTAQRAVRRKQGLSSRREEPQQKRHRSHKPVGGLSLSLTAGKDFGEIPVFPSCKMKLIVALASSGGCGEEMSECLWALSTIIIKVRRTTAPDDP